MVFSEYYSSKRNWKNYQKKELFKIVILDNAASVPSNFAYLGESIQVVFLNTTLLF